MSNHPNFGREIQAEARELVARSDRRELRFLEHVFERARLELHGRLVELPGDKFSAQQVRMALVQVQASLRELLRALYEKRKTDMDDLLGRSIRQTLREIAHHETKFAEAQGRIQARALRKLASPRGLLLHQYQVSLQAYGQQTIGDIQRRLAVHAVKKSTVREMANDIAGRLPTRALQGARWKAERIVRTELIAALNTGHQAALEEAAEFLPDLQRQWDAALDARTSDVCRTLNGQVRALDQPWKYSGRLIAHPPAHPNCRSRITPWRADWMEEA